MRFDKTDLNLFVVFDAIYRERSLTRVAVHLNITQPAVSNALSRLRQAFDDPLFVRSPEGMAPTPVADIMIRDVQTALELLRRTLSVNTRFDPANSEKVFRLGMNDMTESLLLPRLHSAVKAQAPNVILTSYYVARESATEELKAGLIDLLLDTPVVNARELQQRQLTKSPYVLAMRKGHPMSCDGVSLEDYLAGEHLHVSSRRKGRGHVDIALHHLGKRRKVVMRVQNYLVAARIAQETDLLWTMPRVLAGSLPLITVVDLPFVVESLAWNLYWSRSTDDDPANCWIREIIEEVVIDL